MPQLIHHDTTLVVLSFLLAYFASLTALDMGTRLRKSQGKVRRLWLTGSAVVLGGGIWSMHFVAMLAMNAGVPLGYAPGLTIFSLILAIAIVALGFHVVTVREKPSIGRQLMAGAIVGAGVSVMHYSGMAAVVLPGWLQYDPKLVAASVVIAVVAATAALWLTLNLRNWWQRAVAAGVMAVAVCGMHYTAMAATQICTNPGAKAGAAPISDLFLAAGVCAGVFLILCLAMVCVFVDRRFELMAEREAESLRAANQRLVAEVAERQAAQGELSAANDALEASQAAVRNLLDNADQGFLTLSPSLTVDEQSSAACASILGRPPAGEPITELLCPDLPPEDVANFRDVLESLFRETNEGLRELKIELLPSEFLVAGKSLRAGYKFLADRKRLMLVLTDVTETTRLAEAVEEERRRLEMTVLSIKDGDTFWSLVSDYRSFLVDELPVLCEGVEAGSSDEELHRRLHTFKGLLAQFSFRWSPSALHDAETTLADVTGARALKRLSIALTEALERDLEAVGQSIDGTTDADGAPARLREFARQARSFLADGQAQAEQPEVRDFLAVVAKSGMIDLKATLGLYGCSATRLAERLDKKLLPIDIAGDEIRLEPERYRAFLRSLVHVFRNAVDHGIEPPEQRIALGKPEEGRITCAVRERRDSFEILIADDGGGVQREALEAKLVAAGEPPERITPVALSELIFRQGLSSKDEVSTTSGRGVGLAAVKHELDQLRGSASAESIPGEGVQFIFRIPNPANNAEMIHKMRKVAS